MFGHSKYYVKEKNPDNNLWHSDCNLMLNKILLMGMLKLMVVGAAVAAGIHYITKKREDGTSIMDDIKEKAPEWMDKAKPLMDQVKSQFGGNHMQHNASMNNPM